MARRIEIVEVGPRDGLQNEKRVLSVEDRVHFIGLLEAAGVRRIEAVSFVNPARVPQMAGAEEIMSRLPAPAKGARRIGLVLNERGWERCVAAGCDEANVVVCASDGFGIRNQGADTDAQIETLARIMERSRTEGPPVSATVSVAFGCPFDGEVPEARLTAIVRAMAQTGVGEIALADTIGVADPWTVRRRVEAARSVAPDARLRLHFHDTRARAWPMPLPGWRREWTCWTPAAAASAAVPSRPMPRATSPRRTWSTCWAGRGSTPASTWTP